MMGEKESTKLDRESLVAQSFTPRWVLVTFLSLLALSLVDAYVYPLLFAESFPFPPPVAALAEAVVLTVLGYVGAYLFYSRAPELPEVDVPIGYTVPLFVFLAAGHVSILLCLDEAPGFVRFTAFCLGIGAFSSVLLVAIQRRGGGLNDFLAVMGGGRERLILLVLVVSTALTTVMDVVVSLFASEPAPFALFVAAMVPWSVMWGVSSGFGMAVPLSVAYYHLHSSSLRGGVEGG